MATQLCSTIDIEELQLLLTSALTSSMILLLQASVHFPLINNQFVVKKKSVYTGMKKQHLNKMGFVWYIYNADTKCALPEKLCKKKKDQLQVEDTVSSN